MLRITRALSAALLFACATVVASPDPASAHGPGGIQPSNYETRITSVRPQVDGIDLRAVDLGSRLELRNTTGTDVIVIGYDDEPYLRVGPRGVFENVRSPAVYLNRTRYATSKVPDRANPNEQPRWRRVSTSTTARWHDHRAHWMGRDDPSAVQHDPGSRHLVQRFTVTLYEGQRLIRATGDVRWVPGPSPLPWALAALALLATLLVVSGTRYAPATVTVALGLLAVSAGLHVTGAWGATTASGLAKLAASAYAIGGGALALVALVWVVRRGLEGAAPLILLAGMFVAIASGLADVGVLSHSQLPTTGVGWLARLEVNLAVGLGVGLASSVGRRCVRPRDALRSSRRPHCNDHGRRLRVSE